MKLSTDYFINIEKVLEERSIFFKAIKRGIDLLAFLVGFLFIVPVAIII